MWIRTNESKSIAELSAHLAVQVSSNAVMVETSEGKWIREVPGGRYVFYLTAPQRIKDNGNS